MPSDTQGEQVAVIHSMNIWLSQTMTWLYTQIQALPAEVHSHVVCEKTANLDQFPLRNLTSVDRERGLWRAATRNSWRLHEIRERMLLKNVLSAENVGILHSHFGDRGWTNTEFAESNNLRHVVTFYGYDASRLPADNPVWRDRYKRLFESADLFLCEGPFLAETLEGLGCPGNKIRVHHLGVRVDDIEFRPLTHVPGEPLRVLIAGTFVQKKGIPTAIYALDKVCSQIELQVTIVGDSNGQARSEAEKQAIRAAVEESKLHDRVDFLGYQRHDDLMELAYRHHVFLSPSQTADDGDSEGGAPVSLIEMSATGIQIVSTKHCDIPNVVIDGKTGHLAVEKDISSIAEKLLFVGQNTDLWHHFAKNARTHIEREFNSSVQADRLSEIYLSLLRKGAGQK